MKLTVLGTCGPFPRPGSACSGYLLESGGTKLVLDCGSGTVSRLLQCTDPDAIDGIVLTHLHFDHCSDLGVLRYACDSKRKSGSPLKLFAPKADGSALTAFLDGSKVFDYNVVCDGTVARVGDLTLRFFSAVHPVEAYSVRIECGGKTFFYTGDTALHDGLADAMRGADLAVADACFNDAQAAAKPGIHMSVSQVAAIRNQAGVGTMILSHHFGGSDELPSGLPDGCLTACDMMSLEF